jgi:hypothetical protein
MKTTLPHRPSHLHSSVGAVCAGAVLLLTCNAPGQNLFVSFDDSGPFPNTDRIYQFTPGGVQSTFASGLSIPLGMTFDSVGNLFATEQQSGNVYRFTPGGVKTTFASGLYEPWDLAFDSAGNLFEVDFGSHFANTGFLHKFAPDGTMTTIGTGLNPTAVAIDTAGNLFVTDVQLHGIYKFTPGGVRTTFASGLGTPLGIGLQQRGRPF